MLTTLHIDDAAPWKRRFRAPAILWTRLAASAPGRGLAVTNRSGAYQLYAWYVPTGELTQLAHRPEGRLFGTISPDGRFVYYLDDQQDNEIGHFARIPFEGGEPQDVTPDMPPYSSFGLEISRAGNRLGFTGADRDGFHTYCVTLSSDGALGTPRRFYHTTRFAFGPVLSHDGEIAVVSSTERSGRPQFSLLAFDTTSGEQVAELWDGPGTSLDRPCFAPIPGDTRLLAMSNHTGFGRPLVWDPRTGERTDLPLDSLDGEVEIVDWSPDGQRLLLCQPVKAVQRLFIYDLVGERLTRLLHPDGSFSFDGGSGTYFGPEGEIFAQWTDATSPPQLIALDVQTGAQTRTILPAGEAPPGRPWKPVTFPSFDGQEVQGWLGLPDGHGPFPTILETHGGPEAVTTETFEAGSQAWLDHGFAYLTINYRGSTTFGKAFQEQIWGHPGDLEVQDMVAARDWLVAQGFAHPDQILLTGWSYGGYLTLQALGVRPDLWAGGMAGIAIADWSVQYEDSADTLRGYQVALLGGTPEEEPEQYAASSPITYAEQVQAPVLIIQGRNDTRTPARPVEMYAAKLESLGKPVEVHWFDAGHLGSFAQVEQSIAHQELMLRFAYRVLG